MCFLQSCNYQEVIIFCWLQAIVGDGNYLLTLEVLLLLLTKKDMHGVILLPNFYPRKCSCVAFWHSPRKSIVVSNNNQKRRVFIFHISLGGPLPASTTIVNQQTRGLVSCMPCTVTPRPPTEAGKPRRKSPYSLQAQRANIPRGEEWCVVFMSLSALAPGPSVMKFPD